MDPEVASEDAAYVARRRTTRDRSRRSAGSVTDANVVTYGRATSCVSKKERRERTIEHRHIVEAAAQNGS
jgi:hypothetical protein